MNKAIKKSKPEIETQIKHVLDETRIIVPGTQVLLAFQFAAVFQEGFSKMTHILQYFYLLSLCSVSLAIIMLFGIVSFHRVAERGHDTKRFYLFTHRVLLVSLMLLGLGLCIDIGIVFSLVTSHRYLSAAVAFLFALFAFFFWFVYTMFQRNSGKR